MKNWMKATILIVGMFAVAAFNSYLGISFIASFLIGIAYGTAAVPVYAAWAD